MTDDADSTGAKDIVVTGSLIRGREDASLPIDVISSEELLRQGSPSVVELLKALPTSNGIIGDSNQFDSRSQGAEGIASVNLRGLGPGRTLVLLNSKRLVPAGNGVPAVDINLLPLAAIGRIEVLKDGAAATYGSDAIAGVVNFITKRDQQGFLFSGDFKQIDGSQGDYTLSGSYGYHNDKWRVLAAAGFQHRSELMTTDRKFAVQPFLANPEGGFTGGGNPASFLPVSATGTPLGAVRFDSSCVPLGGFITAQNRCSTQFSGFDALTDTENRYQLYAEGGYHVTPDIEFEVTALYGRSQVPHYRTSPSYLLTQGPSGTVLPTPNPTAAVAGFFVPSSNPGYQLYRQQNPGTIPASAAGVVFPLLLYRPFLTGGNPGTGDQNAEGSQEGNRISKSTRVTAELSGKLTDTLNFDVSAVYHNYDRYIDGYDTYGDRVQLALRGLGGVNCNAAANTPGANGCVYLNPFGNAVEGNPTNGLLNPAFNPAVANSAALSDYLFAKTSQTVRTQLFVAEASVSGPVGLTLPGGDIAFAVGGQFRKSDYKSTLNDNNNLLVTPCRDTPINGNRICNPSIGAFSFLGTNLPGKFSSDVYAVFGELQVPVFDSFDVQLAARYEDYGGGVGSTFNPKATARWQAVDWLAFRGSIGTTFRGPPAQNLSPGGVTSLQVIGSSFRPVDVFGNASLKPESSDNYSAGVIFDAGGFNATLDYFRYDLKGQIIAEPVAGIVNTMFGAGGTLNCANPAFAGLRSRFLFNDGSGIPGAGTCNQANVARLKTFYVNGSKVSTSGLDMAINYRNRDMLGGRVGAGINATYIIEYKIDPLFVEGVVVQPGFDAVGKLNYQTSAYPLPQWKGQAFVEYGRGWFDTRLTMNYVDSYLDQRLTPFAARPDVAGNPTLPQGKTIKSYTTFDLNMRATLVWDMTLSFTIINVANKDPSFARLDYSYDPFTGSPLGRQYKFGFTKTF